MIDWGSIAAAVTSLCGIGTIIYYIRDNSRYRRDRERQEDVFKGELKQTLKNIETNQEKQESLCASERKNIWERMDENSDGVAFIRGKLNVSPH